MAKTSDDYRGEMVRSLVDCDISYNIEYGALNE